MPVAKIHVTEGQYDEARLSSVSAAVQDSLMLVLGVPPDDFSKSSTFFHASISRTRRPSSA